MSKKTKLSQAELKALAIENCDRFLVVHCGFCLDENSKVDRTQPLGWLTHRPGNKTSPSVWRVVASHGQTDVMQRLICPKCLRYLDMPDDKYSYAFQQTFLLSYPKDRRTTMRQILIMAIEYSQLKVEDLDTLRADDDPGVRSAWHTWDIKGAQWYHESVRGLEGARHPNS